MSGLPPTHICVGSYTCKKNKNKKSTSHTHTHTHTQPPTPPTHTHLLCVFVDFSCLHLTDHAVPPPLLRYESFPNNSVEVLRSGVRDVIEDVIIAVIRFLRSAKFVSNCTFVIAKASVFDARHHQDAFPKFSKSVTVLFCNSKSVSISSTSPSGCVSRILQVSNCTFVLAKASVFQARHHQDAFLVLLVDHHCEFALSNFRIAAIFFFCYRANSPRFTDCLFQQTGPRQSERPVVLVPLEFVRCWILLPKLRQYLYFYTSKASKLSTCST